MADKAKEKVKEKIANKVENEVSDAADAVLDGKKSNNNSSKSKAEKKESSSTRDEAPAAQVSNQKSDFVPGSVVIFEANFANEKKGEFPSKWDHEEITNRTYSSVLIFFLGVESYIKKGEDYLRGPHPILFYLAMSLSMT